ncbi:MAG: T9SS type A sorting domain-containing protein [Bacteroidetes bacterium]|nr:T9SS type A sorting domain-containing protein [Bacteroidota bacterium]
MYNDWKYYPFQQSGDISFCHRFTVDSEGMVLHEGTYGSVPYQLYPAFLPKGTQVTLNGDIWNVPRLLDTTVLGVQTHGFEIERHGLRRIITERFGETRMIFDGEVVMALSSAVVRDTAFNRDAVQRNYLPLCVGNHYVFFYDNTVGVHEERLTQVTETAELDGRTWYHLEGDGPLTGWYRSDSTGVYKYSDSQESLIIESTASLGTLRAQRMVIDTGIVTPFPNGIDTFFHANVLLFSNDVHISTVWLADFGLYELDGRFVWSDSYRYTYIWGVICGETIGVVVDVDPAHPSAESTSIDDIFPNPASNLATAAFTLPHAMQTEFVLTDMLGRRVRQLGSAEYPAGSHRATVRLQGLRPGLYLLTLRTPSVTVTRRVVVAP